MDKFNLPPAETPLQFLARRTFPDYTALTAPNSANRLLTLGVVPTPERFDEFNEWWLRHAALPPAELAALVHAERGKEGAEADASRFFGQPSAAADFQHWARMPRWPVEQAVALSYGNDPVVVNWASVEPFTSFKGDGLPSSFALDYAKRRQVALEAVRWRELDEPSEPSLFIRWCERKSYAFPAELRDLISERGSIEDWRDLYEKQSGNVTQLMHLGDRMKESLEAMHDENAQFKEQLQRVTTERDEVLTKAEALRAQLAAVALERDTPAHSVSKAPSVEALATRERSTLLKLVVGMAVGGYKYDTGARRNAAVADIVKDLGELGIPVGDDTIRKWLKEAADTVLPASSPNS